MGNTAVPGASDGDRDGLSFFTEAAPTTSGPTVFGLPDSDPLERVFGSNPVVREEAMGTADLSATASTEQVMGDISGRVTDRTSSSWKRSFILYGPPHAATVPSTAPTTSFLGRWRRKGSEES